MTWQMKMRSSAMAPCALSPSNLAGTSRWDSGNVQRAGMHAGNVQRAGGRAGMLDA